MGDVVQAIDRYQDIPAEQRARLKARMTQRQYDDVVDIRRDSIAGESEYDPTIRDMHFGNRTVCRSVTRATWAASMQERGLVYCDGGECILVPTVCRNVSRITRLGPGHAGVPGDGVPGGPGDVIGVVPPPALVALDGPPSFIAPGDVVAPLVPAVTGPGTPVDGPAPPVGPLVGPPFGPGLLVPPPALPAGPGTPTGQSGPPPPGGSTGSPPPPGGGTGGPPPPGGGTGGPPGPPAGPPPVITAPVPEPETWALTLSGLVAITWLRRRSLAKARAST
jgi:hypothetical protein